MSNELIRVFGTQKTLEASGALIGNNSVVQANDADYSIVADGGSYPDAEFSFAATFASPPYKGSAILLYARDLNFDGTSDAEIPDAIRPGVIIGAFTTNNVTTRQYMKLVARDVPTNAAYYLHNLSGYEVSAGWALKVTPRTIKPAP